MTRFARLAVRLIRRGFLILLIPAPGLSAIVVVQYTYTFAEAVLALSLGTCPDRGARRDHRRAGGGRRGGHRHRHRLSGCQLAADRGAGRCAERRGRRCCVSALLRLRSVGRLTPSWRWGRRRRLLTHRSRRCLRRAELASPTVSVRSSRLGASDGPRLGWRCRNDWRFGAARRPGNRGFSRRDLRG
jgi:hypothetical protein